MSKITINIKNVYNQDDLFSKIAELKIGSSETFKLLPAAPSKIKSNTIRSINDKLIVENYITLTLAELRSMDSDSEKQGNFIKNKVKVLANYPFIILKLLVKKDDIIKTNDVEYLVDLLKSPLNTFIVTPLIYYYWESKKGTNVVGKPIPLDTYLLIIDTFLKRMKDGYNIDECAIAVPSNASRSSIGMLLQKYKDIKTQIAVIDLNGKTAINIYPLINALTVVATLNKKDYTLPEKNGEDYILYAFDSVPYNFSSRGEMPAKDILQYAMGFGSFGPRHTIKFSVEQQLVDSGKRETYKPKDNPKLYEPNSYTYFNDKSTKYNSEIKKLEDWEITTFGKGHYKRSSYAKDYNFIKLTDSANEIFSGVKESTLNNVLNEKKNILNYLRIIKSYNKGAFGTLNKI